MFSIPQNQGAQRVRIQELGGISMAPRYLPYLSFSVSSVFLLLTGSGPPRGYAQLQPPVAARAWARCSMTPEAEYLWQQPTEVRAKLCLRGCHSGLSR